MTGLTASEKEGPCAMEDTKEQRLSEDLLEAAYLHMCDKETVTHA